MAIQVTQNADGSLTLGTSSLGPITASASSITIAGQFVLPVTADPRIALALAALHLTLNTDLAPALADAQAALAAAQKVVNDLTT